MSHIHCFRVDENLRRRKKADSHTQGKDKKQHVTNDAKTVAQPCGTRHRFDALDAVAKKSHDLPLSNGLGGRLPRLGVTVEHALELVFDVIKGTLDDQRRLARRQDQHATRVAPE